MIGPICTGPSVGPRATHWTTQAPNRQKQPQKTATMHEIRLAKENEPETDFDYQSVIEATGFCTVFQAVSFSFSPFFLAPVSACRQSPRVKREAKAKHTAIPWTQAKI